MVHQATRAFQKYRVEWNGCDTMACGVTRLQPYREIVGGHGGRVRLGLGEGEPPGGTGSSNEGFMGF